MTLDEVMAAADLFAHNTADEMWETRTHDDDVIYNCGAKSNRTSLRAAILSYGQAERERCAQACDRRNMGDCSREDQEAQRCAADIRALPDEEA